MERGGRPIRPNQPETFGARARLAFQMIPKALGLVWQATPRFATTNAILTAAFAVLFFVSGLLLWYGEQDTRFRLGGTVYLHDSLMYVSVVVVVGHLYLAVLNPSTRHALRGMTLGTVREDWARAHHAKWTPSARFVVQRPAEASQRAVGSEAAGPKA